MLQRDTRGDFWQLLQDRLAETDSLRFDQYIVQYMGFSSNVPEREREEEYRKAYLTFLHEIKGENVASLPTIRRWFGIHEFREPTREQVFRICLALKVGVEAAKDFLMKGIHEPSFQIADYEEMILMYCLENRFDCDKYASMLREYEKNLDLQKEIRHESNTQWLFSQFESIKNYPEQDFMYWMWENASTFKGYSMTAQEYLGSYREMVLSLSRQEIKKQLELFLSETGYPAWRKQRKLNGKREDVLIRKYLNKNSVPEDLRDNILELARLVYSESGQNTVLLSELFRMSESAATQEPPASGKGSHFVTNKYLSDLFNIPLQSERLIRVRQAFAELEKLEKESPCPEQVMLLIHEYSRGAVRIENVEEAGQWLSEYEREHKRRRKIVKRTDLLPLIHYVSQQRYLQESEENGQPYDQMEAKKQFRTMADAVMIACNMAPIDEDYRYDRILMLCFDKEEMHSYMDILEFV